MKVKFVSKLNKMSEIVFLVLSKKSALKNINAEILFTSSYSPELNAEVK